MIWFLWCVTYKRGEGFIFYARFFCIFFTIICNKREKLLFIKCLWRNELSSSNRFVEILILKEIWISQQEYMNVYMYIHIYIRNTFKSLDSLIFLCVNFSLKLECFKMLLFTANFFKEIRCRHILKKVLPFE